MLALRHALANAGQAVLPRAVPRTATGRNERRSDNPHPRAPLVIIEPDIELTEVTAGGLQEPRREWTTAARDELPDRGSNSCLAHGKRPRKSACMTFRTIPLPGSRLGQVLRLNQEVSMSIAQYSATLAACSRPKKDPVTGRPLLGLAIWAKALQEIRTSDRCRLCPVHLCA